MNANATLRRPHRRPPSDPYSGITVEVLDGGIVSIGGQVATYAHWISPDWPGPKPKVRPHNWLSVVVVPRPDWPGWGSWEDRPPLDAPDDPDAAIRRLSNHRDWSC